MHRVFIFLGAFLGLATILIGLILLSQGGRPGPPPPEAELTPETEKVVIAVQNIPEGETIVPEAVELREIETDQIPPNAIYRLDEAIGKLALINIFQGQVIQRDMVTSEEEILREAKNASILIPKGKVAVAFPIDDISSVAYAIQAGDLVDVLITMKFIDLNEEYQLERPVAGYVPTEKQEGQVCEPCLPQPGNSVQIPRPVTQLIVQDAEVLKVGLWGEVALPQPTPEGGATPEEGEVPTPPPRPELITLLVTRQDALVLKYALESGANIDLALRSSGDHDVVTTEPVTLDYMLARFGITVPPKRPYTLQTFKLEPAAAR